MRHGVRDWDCIEAINGPNMEKALVYIREEGKFPPFVDSKEDQNSIGTCPVSPTQIAAAKQRVDTWLSTPNGAAFIASQRSLCLLDGFLLFTPKLSFIMSLLDVKLFLLVSRAKATQRRESRDGYVTLEGFWKDPPGYVDKIVWPNYVQAHSWLFNDGDVEGPVNEQVASKEGIKVQSDKSCDVDMASTLDWAVSEIINYLEAAMG
ncbi:Nicotinamide riboside kinase [Ceratocystis fimbriata CBS 114723]|uniref:Nicotinamide riboside kinase n=1 Tax=Ceratocystis fimbriata CBS 114723 TaxID=1035309 RepID=A0A2C5X7V9_9PEZI|nr:Nicotinamide riboside kinase [Ceratocystis fimbriata CBS 114723]